MRPQGEETEPTEVIFRDTSPQYQDECFCFGHRRQGGNSDLYFNNYKENEDIWNTYWADKVPGSLHVKFNLG